MYTANPVSPSAVPTSLSLKNSAFVHSQAARKGEHWSPLLRAAPWSLRDLGTPSRHSGRLCSVGLSGPITNSAIDSLFINLVDSYSLITFWGNSDEARKLQV